MAVSSDPDSYEWAIARVTELEVDLANAVAGLERAQSDNGALRNIHEELNCAYRRLQEQQEQLRNQFRQEQDRQQQLLTEQQRQVAQWRSKFQARTREYEELQERLVVPRDLEALRVQMAEQIEEPYQQRLRNMEGRLAAEQRRVMESQRQVEQLRVEAAQHDLEQQEEIAELTRLHRQQEQALERRIISLEADARRLPEQEALVARLKGQLRDSDTKVARLQQTLQEQESLSQRERLATADDLRAKVDEASAARRLAHDLRVKLDQAERNHAQLMADLEAARREQMQLAQRVQQAEAQAKAAERAVPEEVRRAREEFAVQQSAAANEKEQLCQSLKAMEDQQHATALELKRTEAQIKQLQESQQQREEELQAQHEEAQRLLALDNASIRAKLDTVERESEARRLTWKEKEVALMKQIESAAARLEALSEELMQCQVVHESLERKLQDTLREQQQRDADLQAERVQRDAETTALREKVHRLEHELSHYRASAEASRADLRRKDQRCDELQAELALANSRLDAQRATWANDAEEAHAAALAAEEQRRTTALNQQAEEHKRQLANLRAAIKKLLQKAKSKRQEYQQRIHELIKRISHLQQEKATAVRVCEENRNAYELRLTELQLMLGAPTRLSLSSELPLAASLASLRGGCCPAAMPGAADATPGGAQRQDRRAVAERLERVAEWLRARQAGPGDPAAARSDAGAEVGTT